MAVAATVLVAQDRHLCERDAGHLDQLPEAVRHWRVDLVGADSSASSVGHVLQRDWSDSAGSVRYLRRRQDLELQVQGK